MITVKKNNISFNVIRQEEIDTATTEDFWTDHYSKWEPETFRALDLFLNNKKDFLDIGAWVGPMSLYASFLSRKVISVEPDTTAFSLLEQNIALNNINNINAINKACSFKEKIYMDAKVCWGSSMTTSLEEQSDNSREVDCISVNDLLKLGSFSLIKVDIEGYEESIIPECIDLIKGIPLYLSFHLPFFRKEDSIEKLIESLSQYNYAYNENLEQVSVNEFSGRHFSSYLFLPKELSDY
jgi:FkbM family methyltransferase